MSVMTIHPRFFSTVTQRSAESGVVVSQGDASIDTLYDLYMGRTVNTSSWAFRRQVLTQALRIFGNFQEWLEHQRANPSVAGRNRDFLEDTIQFIQTGKRQMEIMNWLDLMDEITPTDRPKMVHGPMALLSSANTVQVLQTWCSRTNGIEDLVQTLYVLFGHKHRPN